MRSTDTILTSTARKPELRQLTGLRIVAALWVVFFHFSGQIVTILPEGGFIVPASSTGYLAVDVFFVLSGFILSYQYADGVRSGRVRHRWFLARRLARIYPAHIVALLLVVAVVAVAERLDTTIADHDYTLLGALQDVLLVRGWIKPSQGWNFPAWSLSAEWLAYCLFPIVLIAVARCRTTSTRLVALALLVVLEAAAVAIAPSYNDMPPPDVRVLLAFTAGVLLQNAGLMRRSGRRADLVATVALLSLVILTPLLEPGVFRAAGGLGLAIILVGSLAAARGPLSRMLSSRILEYGGIISFCVYLVHGIVLTALPLALDPAAVVATPLAVRVSVVLAELTAVLLGAVLLHHLIERPLNRRIVALIRRRERGEPVRRHAAAAGRGSDPSFERDSSFAGSRGEAPTD